MFLTAANIAHYLMSSGLVPAAAIVDGDFAVHETGRRNRNFKVLRESAPGLFVKQAKSLEAQATATLWREAAFATRVQSDPAYAGLAQLMPKLVRYDPARHAIVSNLVDRAESAGEYQGRKREFPEEVATAIGRGLAHIQRFGPALAADPQLRAALPRQVPWVMNLDQTGIAFLRTTAPLGPQLVAELQQMPEFLARLAALRLEWHPDTLMHGDMKWDNCLVRGTDGALELMIIDWELVDIGDAAWDVASIFKEYVVTALFAVIAASQNPTAPPDPDWLARVRPAARQFWKSYVAALGLPPEQSRPLLDRAIRFIAPRLVISVLEYLSVLPNDTVVMKGMLQAAVQFLNAQQLMTANLLGYPV